MPETAPIPLRLLIVEDSEIDALLLLSEMRRGGYAVTSLRVDTPAAMRAALEEEDWDIITSDHAMPAFSAPAALTLAQEISPETPFIIVSGEIDLNLAVSLLKAGAHDYIQKHELPRVVPAIQRELAEMEVRRQQRQAEEERRVSEEKFYKAFHNSPDSINLNRLSDGVFLAVNAGFERMTGYTAEEALGKSSLELNTWANPTDRVRLSKKLLEEGEFNDEEIFGKNKNEQIVPTLVSARLITVNGEQCVLAFNRDLSAQKQAEAEIRRQNQELRAVSLIITVIATQLELPQVIHEALNGVIVLSGMEAGAVYLGGDGPELVLTASSQLSAEELETLRARVIQPTEAIYQDLVTSQKPVIWNSEPGGKLENTPFLSGKGWQLLFPLIAKDNLIGALYLYTSQAAETISASVLELTRQLCGTIALAIENARLYETVQKHASRLEERVAERTEQLSAINQELETFSYSVAHDLRAPLRGISGFVGILMNEYAGQLPVEARQMLEKVSASSRKMEELINALLDFSRLNRKPLTKTSVELNEVAQEMIASFAPETSKRKIEWVLGDLPPTTADPILIRQVFANLIGNAIKYTCAREKAKIEIGYMRIEGIGAYFIRDNGVGFEMSQAGKLFGLFQRLHTESEFEGTGVGLANVQRIILRHGGRIWAEAEPNRGATFYFTL